MNERLCLRCEHFSPAHTCVDKPVWGYCTKLVGGDSARGAGEGKPLFTWADNSCDDFRPGRNIPMHADG